MVNRGASGGCLTCRQRRVKCDENRPFCNRCASAGFACAGYGRKAVNIRFKTQVIDTQQKGDNGVGMSSAGGSLSQLRPSENEETLAVNFFINTFAIGGRSLDSSRGFFESIVPIFSSALPDSAVSKATSAVSALLLSRWRRSTDTTNLSRVRLGQALQQLQTDLAEPSLRMTDSTLLSILMLQCYENTRAVLKRDKVDTVHRDGAIILLKSLGLEKFRSDHAKRLLLYVLNCEVSAALQEGRPVDPALALWLGSAPDMPWNTSSELDKIGIRVARLQSIYSSAQISGTKMAPGGHLRDPDVFEGELNDVLAALATWTQSMPQLWNRRHYRALQQPEPRVDMYLDHFDIYPSIQIASIWNTSRLYTLRTLLLKHHLQVQDRNSSDTVPPLMSRATEDHRIRELVDSICYSVPFYLGNRTQPTALENTTSSPVVFPNIHTLPLFGLEPEVKIPQAEVMSREAFESNARSQGAWQLLPYLAQLDGLLSKAENEALRNTLHRGQMQWIQTQLLRVERIFGAQRQEAMNTTTEAHDAGNVNPGDNA